MTTEEKVARRKLSLLELAVETSPARQVRKLPPPANLIVNDGEGKRLSSPAAIAPITTPSEEQKEDNNNKDEFHNIPPNMENVFPLICGIGIIFYQLRNLRG